MPKKVHPNADSESRTCAHCGEVYVPSSLAGDGHDRAPLALARLGRGRPAEAAYAYRCDATAKTKALLGPGSDGWLLRARLALGEARQHLKAHAHVQRLIKARKALRRMQRLASDLKELAQTSLETGYAPLGMLAQDPNSYWAAIESISDHVSVLGPKFDTLSRRAEAATADFYSGRSRLETADLERRIVTELRAAAPELVRRGPTLLAYWGIAVGFHPPVKAYAAFKKYVDRWKSAMRPLRGRRPQGERKREGGKFSRPAARGILGGRAKCRRHRS
jgi:hypothetical protein